MAIDLMERAYGDDGRPAAIRRTARQAAGLSRRQLFGWAAGGAAMGVMSGPAQAFWQATNPYPVTQAFLDAYVTSQRLPGALAAVGLGDAQVALIKAGTIALGDATPVDLDTLWRIYSMSKPITGMAAMMLIDQGRMSLDQPLGDILPAFANMRVLTSVDAPIDQTVAADRPILIRHLLTHTAGLGYAIVQTGPIKAAFAAAGIVSGKATRLNLPGVDNFAPAPSLEAFCDRLGALPLVYQPGTKWSYSAGLDVMGRVIEVVSGQPFDSFLKTQMFDPLGMASTSFVVAPADVPRLSTNYAPFGGSLFPVDPAATSVFLDSPTLPLGGAGLVSSARDYDRFLHMLLGEGQLGGVRLMSTATARLAMSNLLPEGVDLSGTWVADSGFGAGGRVSLPGSPRGEGYFGWSGAAGTTSFVHRGRGMRFGGFANYFAQPGVYDFQSAIADKVFADLGQA